jgi:ACS family D-galactonate transporter-like MFS transporter
MKTTKTRYFIVFLLFVVTAINYMDRANLSIADSRIQGEFGLSLSKAGLGASIPYLMAMVGMLAGGFLSDSLLKKGKSVTLARKLPVIVGLVLTAMIVTVNFFENQPIIAIGILSLAFFGNNVANLGWVVFTDVIPRNFIGTMGGFLNLFGNLSGITTPIVFGMILQRTHSFHYAMWYVSIVAVLGILSYIFLVGKIEMIVPPKKQERDAYRVMQSN